MKKTVFLFVLVTLIAAMFSACVPQRELVNMEKTSVNGKSAIKWENRTYVIFCVVSKRDLGEQIGYINGDRDDRVSAYLDYSPEEWLAGWLPMDGGAMLYKEIGVKDIPEGLEAEY